jgi:PAS domain-containing protein
MEAIRVTNREHEFAHREFPRCIRCITPTMVSLANKSESGREAPLQATLNVIPAYTWYALPSGALTFVNERLSDYLGLPKDHPLRSGIDTGASWDSHISLLHPDDQEESRRVWSTCLRTGRAAEVTWSIAWHVDRHTTVRFLAAYYEVGSYLRETQPLGKNTAYFSVIANYKF